MHTFSSHTDFKVQKIAMATSIPTIPALPIVKVYALVFMYVPVPVCMHTNARGYAFLQGCQTSNFNEEITYNIANAGEEIYIDPDGIPYVFYTGPGGR
jgi:hypothetical protein